MRALSCHATRLAVSAALFDAITAISSFHDLTNDAAPSSCSLARERVDIDAGRGELRQHVFAVAAVGAA